VVTPGSRGISRAPRYSGARRESAHFRLLGCHHLWPTIPGRSSSLLICHSPGIRQVPRRVLQLQFSIGLPPTKLHWFRLVRFRSPLLTESLRFPFLRVLRCFSSPAYLLTAYGFSSGSPGITLEGLPHSDIPGSQPAGGSPGLIAAIHVLHRLLVPRHPPCALASSASRSLDLTKPAGSMFSIKRLRKRPNSLSLYSPALLGEALSLYLSMYLSAQLLFSSKGALVPALFEPPK
jgi:hypothetical protein